MKIITRLFLLIGIILLLNYSVFGLINNKEEGDIILREGYGIDLNPDTIIFSGQISVSQELLDYINSINGSGGNGTVDTTVLFRNENFTVRYNLITDRWQLINYSNEYSNSGYKNENFTLQLNNYITSFFNNNNFTTLINNYIPSFYNNDNLTSDYPNLDTSNLDDWNKNNESSYLTSEGYNKSVDLSSYQKIIWNETATAIYPKDILKNLAIGTSIAVYPLNVKTTDTGVTELARFIADDDGLVMTINKAADDDAALILFSGAGVKTTQISADDTAASYFNSGSYVGINTNVPTEDLTVVGDALITNNLTVHGFFYVNPTYNRVGIHTALPLADLHIVDSRNSQVNIRLENTNGGSSAYAGIQTRSNVGTLNIFSFSNGYAATAYRNSSGFYTGVGENLWFGTGGAYDVWIDANSRYVGIRTQQPQSQLHAKSAVANDALMVEDNSGACEAQPTTTGLTWSCSSDISLKENIKPPSSKLDYVANIPLHDYTVIKTGEVVTGWIAQEMLANEAYKDLVINRTYKEQIGETIPKNEYDYPTPIYETKSELSVSEIPQPTIIKAIQELKQENDLLKSELCKKDNTYIFCK